MMTTTEEPYVDDLLYFETHLHPHWRPDRSSVPPCLKVEKHPDDDLILKKLDQAHIPWLSRKRYDVDQLIKRQIAYQLSSHRPFIFTVKRLFQASKDANDLTMLNSFIQAAAAFIYLLYRKEYLFLMSEYVSLRMIRRLDEFWKDLTLLRTEAASSEDNSNFIMGLLKNRTKYPNFSEDEAYEILFCCSMNATNPFSYKGLPEFPYTDAPDIFEFTLDVIKKMKSMPAPVKDDDYTRLFVALLGKRIALYEVDEPTEILEHEELDPAQTIKRALLDEAMKFLEHKELRSDLYDMFLGLMDEFVKDLKSQVSRDPLPLSSLYGGGSDYYEREITEIVAVAAVRRMAVGSRFIGRSHLIWAYYECGYGLPSGHRERLLKLSLTDEEHPPYHIYFAAYKAALAAGKKKVTLECFLLAIFFSNDVGHLDEEKMKTVQSILKEFFPGI